MLKPIFRSFRLWRHLFDIGPISVLWLRPGQGHWGPANCFQGKDFCLGRLAFVMFMQHSVVWPDPPPAQWCR